MSREQSASSYFLMLSLFGGFFSVFLGMGWIFNSVVISSDALDTCIQ